MSHTRRVRIGALAVSFPLLLTLAACGDGDKQKAAGAANSACPSTLSNSVSTQLPSDLPAPNGTAYDYSNQGKTQVWFYALNGGPDNLVSLRDAYNTQLKGKGYTIEGTDQEAGAEAEAEFKGAHDGTTNFRALCTGKVVLRLKITS
jgi:hypothetical protein